MWGSPKLRIIPGTKDPLSHNRVCVCVPWEVGSRGQGDNYPGGHLGSTTDRQQQRAAFSRRRLRRTLGGRSPQPRRSGGVWESKTQSRLLSRR